jgi:hypothetical protein
MGESEARRIDVESLRQSTDPPTDDDVPMTSDWQPLDTKEKLLAHLAEINDARDRARVR